jgi:iron complex outermembrane receptor protein
MGVFMNKQLNGKCRTAARCASALATIIALAPAYAQEAPAGDAGKTEQEIIVSATRAVTATKTDTPIIQIPQSISIVTSQQIKDQGALTMQSALEYTAGITNAGDDTRGDFNTIRGFSAVNYLDGLKREFGFVYLPRNEVYTLDRVDVLLGPAAVLYGAGSSGGLVNMESKRPQFQFGGEVTASYGTFDRKQAQFDITGPLSDTIAVRLVGLYRDADMLVDHLPDNRKIVQPSITWKPDDKTEVTLLGLYQHDYTGPSNYLPLAATLYAPEGKRVSRRTELGEPDFDKGPKDDKSLTLLIDHSFSNALKFHSASRVEGDHTTYGQIYGVYYVGPTILDPFVSDLGDGQSYIPRSLFAYKAHYKSFDTDNNLQFDFKTGPFTHKILAGVDYSYFHQMSQQAFDYLTVNPIDIYNPVYTPGTVADYGPLTRQVLIDTGFYGQDQIRFEDRASLVVGVRHDHLKSENSGLPNQIDNATTFRAGLTVDVTKGLSPYVSYSESFQPVSGLSQFGNTYKPLYGKSYEGGIKWQPVQGAMIRATYYEITERNHLVPDPAQPLNSIQAGKVKSKGFEFQGNYNVARNFTVSVAYAHNSTKLSGQDRQQDVTPKDTASIFGTKTIPLREDVSLRVGGGVRYVGHQISGDTTATSIRVVTPHYALVDALVALDVKKWTLQVNVVNLLNKYYYAACDTYGSCENGDPQTFNVALTYHF